MAETERLTVNWDSTIGTQEVREGTVNDVPRADMVRGNFVGLESILVDLMSEPYAAVDLESVVIP
jgi:hypothetical protein